MRLLKKLKKNAMSGEYPFHMPGHKRNKTMFNKSCRETCSFDITEIEGFDNLHAPKDTLKEYMEHAAKVCGSKYTYFLVNGSSCGNIASILATVERGGKLIMVRNCHKSVYHAVCMNDLTQVYLYPEDGDVFSSAYLYSEDREALTSAYLYQEDKENLAPSYLHQGEPGFCGKIAPSAVERALSEHPDASAVIITSPTYEGIVSDIEKIATIVHKFNKILIVDEAHGAHFGFHEFFPKAAHSLGADISIQSVHKTLTGYTQSAVLHLNSDRVDKKRLEEALRIVQSSSPSYILMAGIDEAYHLIEKKGKSLFDKLEKQLTQFRREAKQWKHFVLLEGEQGFYDPSKLVIICKNLSFDGKKMTGKMLSDILRHRYGLVMELSSYDYVIAMTSIADKEEGFLRLERAMKELDGKVEDLEISESLRTKESSESLEYLRTKEGSESLEHLRTKEGSESLEHLRTKEGSESLERLRMKEGSELSESREVKENSKFGNEQKIFITSVPLKVLNPSECFFRKKEKMPIDKAEGKIAGDYICLYPPGVPLLVPGERIGKETIAIVKKYLAVGMEIQGLDEDNENFWIISE